MVQISIVIPMKNEAENIGTLIADILQACAKDDIEVIAVDDASTDASADVVRGMMAKYDNVRLLQHDQSGGQSAAVMSGVRAAKGEFVATLDGDGQNPASELPKLYAPLIDPKAPADLGLVAGQRVKRQDTWSKRYASKFANGLRGWALDDGTRDTGCGLKAFRRDAFLALPFFNHMHRYLPALFKRDGWQVALVDVSHRARVAGKSNYSNWQRGLVGAVDLVGVMWLLRRRKTAKAAEIQKSGRQK
ncbi:MAG: glycosyltransferase family 2 protein [Paracoccaceae bacterium]